MLAAFLRQAVRPILSDLAERPRPGARDRGAFDRKVRDYHVKTVETQAELRRVLALRRTVFHYEFAGKWLSLRSDQDAFDMGADHLAIFDTKSDRLAGVYRLIPSHAESRFYSATEYDIGRFLAIPGRKLELSRACIHKDYRNGVVIALLWKGLAEYAKLAKADYLFGLSSVNTVDPETIVKIHQGFVRQALVDTAFGIEPVDKYRIPGFSERMDARPPGDAAEDLVPPLLKSYLKAGAKVCSQPVIDRDFQCADWLTVLDLKRLTAAYDRKFMRD